MVGWGGRVTEHLDEQGEGGGGEAVGEAGMNEGVQHGGGERTNVAEEGAGWREEGLEEVAFDEGIVNEAGDHGAGMKLRISGISFESVEGTRDCILGGLAIPILPPNQNRNATPHNQTTGTVVTLSDSHSRPKSSQPNTPRKIQNTRLERKHPLHQDFAITYTHFLSTFLQTDCHHLASRARD